MAHRTYLRAFEKEDYRATIDWHNDNAVMLTVVGPKRYVSQEYEKQWIDEAIFDKENYRLAVCLKEDHRLIGLVSFTGINWINRNAVSGWLIGDKSLWGKGFATEAVLQLLKFGFQERGFHRISCSILESNIGSIRVAEKCGYRQEGLLRDAVFKDGKFHNLAILAILASEFASLENIYD